MQNQRILLYQTTMAYLSAILNHENPILKEEQLALLAKINVALSHLQADHAEFNRTLSGMNLE